MDEQPKFFEYVELFVKEVIDCSSQYGADGRTAYVAENVVGPPSTFPEFSDSTSSFALRNYGTGWLSTPAALSPISGGSKHYSSTDYIDVFFDRSLIVTAVEVFETYYPGAVVALRACYRDQPAELPVNARGLYWVTLWQATGEIPLNAVTGGNSLMPASASQATPGGKSNIPLVPTDLIRVEFDIRRCPYHTQIDAIKVKGYSPVSAETAQRFNEMNSEVRSARPVTNAYRSLLATRSENFSLEANPVDFSHSAPKCLPPIPGADSDELDDCLSMSLAIPSDPRLTENAIIAVRSSLLCPLSMTVYDMAKIPSVTLMTQSTLAYRSSLYYNNCPLLRLSDDVLLHIFSFLDLHHLCQVSSVCRLFYQLADYAITHLRSVNLQAYWLCLNDTHLLNLGQRLAIHPSMFTCTRRGNRPFQQQKQTPTSVRYHSWNARHLGVAEQATVLSGSPSPAITGAVKRARGVSVSYANSLPHDLTDVVNIDIQENFGASCTENDSNNEGETKLPQINLRKHHLKRLDMSWCGNYCCISPITFCQFLSDVGHQLTTLRLSACRMLTNDSLLHVVNTCGFLQELDISSCRSVTQTGFIPLGRLINLRWLNLYRTNIDEQGLANLAHLCQHLRHISLSSCQKIQDVNEVLAQVAANNPDLESVDLWRCQSLTSEGVMWLADSAPNLQQLDLSWCVGLESQPSNCIPYLVARCRKLRIISLTSIRSVRPTDLEAMGEFLGPTLESLELVGNGLICEAALCSLLSQCPHLRFLDISHCPRISLQCILFINTNYPNCYIISNYHSFISMATGNLFTGIPGAARATDDPSEHYMQLQPPPRLQPLPAPDSVTNFNG